jgi:gliding motility-associated-like protein
MFADCPWTAFSLEVYDRWGALVFRTDQPAPGWDGAIEGRPAPEGTYLYRLQYTYNIQPALLHNNQQTGAVTLIR